MGTSIVLTDFIPNKDPLDINQSLMIPGFIKMDFHGYYLSMDQTTWERVYRNIDKWRINNEIKIWDKEEQNFHSPFCLYSHRFINIDIPCFFTKKLVEELFSNTIAITIETTRTNRNKRAYYVINLDRNKYPKLDVHNLTTSLLDEMVNNNIITSYEKF